MHAHLCPDSNFEPFGKNYNLQYSRLKQHYILTFLPQMRFLWKKLDSCAVGRKVAHRIHRDKEAPHFIKATDY